MIPTVVYLPVIRRDCGGLLVSRRGHDSDYAARGIARDAAHPDLASVFDVIRVSYPVAMEGAALITAHHAELNASHRGAVLATGPRLAALQNGICFLCNRPMLTDDGAPNLHHVIPASKGGRGLPANKALTHVACNGDYGNREPTPVHLDKLLEIYGRHATLATLHLWLARHPEPPLRLRKLHAILIQWIEANA